MPPRYLPNINWVRAVICPAVVFIATGMDRGYQTDFWHHLARGREIAETGSPRGAGVDTFTFTVAGQPVRDANWLTQLAYFRLYELGGLSLVQTANSLVLAAAAAVLVWTCRRRGATPGAAAAVGVFTFAGAWQTLLIRPQSVSLLLFVAMFAVLLEAERRRWLLALPPAIMALWANVHGGFPIGLVLIGAFLAGALLERWVGTLQREVTPPAGMIVAFGACLLASVVATLINPYGAGIYEYVYAISTLAKGRQVEEWLPPSLGMWVGRAWVVSMLGLVMLLALARRRPRVRDVAVTLCFLPLACSSVRMVPWWLLTVAPVLAAGVCRNWPAEGQRSDLPSTRPSVVAAAMLALVGGAVILSVPVFERLNPVFGTLRPADRPEEDVDAMARHITDHPGGDARVFTRAEWGEYLDWAARPRARVFMDARCEIIPADVWAEYHAVTSARADWQSILDRYAVDYLLLDESFHAGLLAQVDASACWQRVDQSGPAILYARRATAAGLALTDTREMP